MLFILHMALVFFLASDFMSKQAGVVATPKAHCFCLNVDEKLLINVHGNDYISFLCIVSWLFPNFLCVFNALCSQTLQNTDRTELY